MADAAGNSDQTDGASVRAALIAPLRRLCTAVVFAGLVYSFVRGIVPAGSLRTETQRLLRPVTATQRKAAHQGGSTGDARATTPTDTMHSSLL